MSSVSSGGSAAGRQVLKCWCALSRCRPAAGPLRFGRRGLLRPCVGGPGGPRAGETLRTQPPHATRAPHSATAGWSVQVQGVGEPADAVLHGHVHRLHRVQFPGQSLAAPPCPCAHDAGARPVLKHRVRAACRLPTTSGGGSCKSGIRSSTSSTTLLDAFPSPPALACSQQQRARDTPCKRAPCSAKSFAPTLSGRGHMTCVSTAGVAARVNFIHAAAYGCARVHVCVCVDRDLCRS